ncbi:MAG TPA: 2-C-methyl-D-erythritol 4-phosphate cytidylyltransferase [Candidatus Eremiobacteraeota bacterium]|nr:MAG: 2-C-methyl-D-erythritol 4-phosphate cytidylyltransferase [bacterium ADurb.Bin363]HPZ09727.1 2-C-methyl-D-erythritol 4-phosphate cytidylyltransferase [Candidatus Eremiobacteraeota bacterium]
MSKVYGLILASGTGERAGFPVPKQFIKVAGKTILEYSLDAFERSDKVDEIITIIHPEFKDLTEKIIKNKYKKVTKVLKGGRIRQESSYRGIYAIDDEHSFVLIHDGVRPFISQKIIDNCIDALKYYDAVAVAIPSVDTLIEINDSKFICHIPDRRSIMRVQTPQAFKLGIIKKAHNLALIDKEVEFTDDCSLVLKYKCAEVYVVNGEERNIKITYPEDLLMFEKFLEEKGMGSKE